MWNAPDVLKQDPAILEAMLSEARRQEDHIELIASENFVSAAVMAAMGSPLTTKYAEGYPGKRYYGGCEFVDIAENIARDRAKELFGAEHANVQPHSGSQANMAVYYALLNPGDVVLGMNLNHGGHLTRGSPVNISGKYFHFESYGVDAQTERIDYDALRAKAREVKPKLIVAGASAYPRSIDFEAFRQIADEAGAYLMVDMAHIAGLVAAGLHPSPIPYAHVVTSTTHKTLRGPRGGLILCQDEYAKAIDNAIFPGIQSGPFMHVIAAKAICFLEALKPSFKVYQQKIIDNATALEHALRRENIPMVSGGTDNHLLLLDFSQMDDMTGLRMETLLGQAKITTNKNMVPRDKRKPSVTSGLRIGTPAVTSRGMNENDMAIIGRCFGKILREKEAATSYVLSEVAKLTAAHPLY